ncbi:MAG: hypothetical protein A2Y62_01480 [Candidatus Fischerbacteria bacterium RBG_13_37_8]|uniref:PPM-type phosphatase domain-containing protein n=1 Tax=Candidatus Fischerbacteria bacterium RBG_13_37_8 TaxID=1817863 RepID=A0A1F5VUY7_9BACT|nr:MAG: hypothetical protein A2Y62_01480 [Candidatus Fischerbacteria bacterium RBG_13_37_8]
MAKTGKHINMNSEFKYGLLMDIIEKVRTTLDLEEVLNHIIDSIKNLINYDSAGIYVLKKELPAFPHSHHRHIIAGLAQRGFPLTAREDDEMLLLGKGIIGYVIKSGETVIIDDVRLDNRYYEGCSTTLSEITVPIFVGDHVIGALNLESNQLNSYNEGDAEILQFISHAAAISIEKAILHQQIIEKKYIENQLKLAQTVQLCLLPITPPNLENYEIASLNIPDFNVGGDYFDYIELPNGKIGIVIADVSGKGIPAALIMATFRASLRTQMQYQTDIPHIVQNVNRFLYESTSPETFVTTVFGILEPSTGIFTYTNCGHPPPLLFRKNGTIEHLACGGLILGFIADITFKSETVQLSKQDLLAFFTDGVIEFGEESGQELGSAGLAQLISSHIHQSTPQMIESLVKNTKILSNGHVHHDDFTIMILRRCI